VRHAARLIEVTRDFCDADPTIVERFRLVSLGLARSETFAALTELDMAHIQIGA
jgi:hypothetical protein